MSTFDSPLSRQLIIAVSTCLAGFSIGGAMTYPTLLLEHYRLKNDSSTQLDIGTKSWIGSIYGFAGIPAIVMPIVAQIIGRKLGFIITCMLLTIGWTLAYFSTDVTELLIGEFFQGLSTNSLMPICFLGITEMIAPKYRMVAMQTYSIVQLIGCASCGIMGQFVHFKTVTLVMLMTIIVAIVSALLWVESPSWLAYKGKDAKCEKTFFKLRGKDDVSMKELKELINAQRNNTISSNNVTSTVNFRRTISKRQFYMPTFHIFVLLTMMYCSGCDFFYIYFIELVAESTNDENYVFYAGITMYLTFIIGVIVSNFLITRFKNKTVLLSSASGVVTFLTLGCVIRILQLIEVLAKHSSLMVYCLLAIIISNSLGLSGIVFMVSTEIIPVKYRNIIGALYIVFNCSLYALTLKLSPYLVLHLDTLGTFLIYIVMTISCGFYVWIYVPETKERTLQEIEEFYVNGKFSERNIDDVESPIND